MKYLNFTYILAFLLTLIIISCSDIQENISVPPAIGVHAEGALIKESENFHSNYFKKSRLEDCQQCHGSDYAGGTAKVGCNVEGCHISIGIHKEGLESPGSDNFHGKYINTTQISITECTQCHGIDYKGGTYAASCATSGCHTSIAIHQEGITDPGSDNFHGKYFSSAQASMSECTQCHGSDYMGSSIAPGCASSGCHPSIGVHQEGISNPSSNNFHGKYFSSAQVAMTECTQCHGEQYQGGSVAQGCASSGCHVSIGVHQQGILNPGSDNFHGKFIASINWKLTECQQCHGTDYSGSTGSTCLTCHNQESGPEACNTCHGQFSDPAFIAPPKDVAGSSETASPGVGAHYQHLFDTKLTEPIACEECHVVPSEFNSPGHIDDSPRAEVVFGTFATSDLSAPVYDYNDYTCSNTYCHGNFEFLKANSAFAFVYVEDQMDGNNYKPVWNKVDNTQAACGTCHGLAPTGHQEAALTACANCHSGVVDSEGNIIDKVKHINKEPNAFGN